VTRLVRAVATTIKQGQSGAISIELDAQGDESALGFSLDFDPAQLQFVAATAGSDAGRANLQANLSQLSGGRLGVALALPPGEALPAGRRQVAVLLFSPATSDSANPIALGFGDTPVAREVVDVQAGSLDATYELETDTIKARALTIVSATSFLETELASEAMAAAFGTGLATITQAAATTPWPVELAGMTVKVRDSAGVERLAPLFFVSPEQVNFQIPAGMAAGVATVITSEDGTVSTGLIRIAAEVPGCPTSEAKSNHATWIQYGERERPGVSGKSRSASARSLTLARTAPRRAPILCGSI
jgi:hypothetical protein